LFALLLLDAPPSALPLTEIGEHGFLLHSIHFTLIKSPVAKRYHVSPASRQGDLWDSAKQECAKPNRVLLRSDYMLLWRGGFVVQAAASAGGLH